MRNKIKKETKKKKQKQKQKKKQKQKQTDQQPINKTNLQASGYGKKRD
jgi:hypothetical protein